MLCVANFSLCANQLFSMPFYAYLIQKSQICKNIKGPPTLEFYACERQLIGLLNKL